MKAGVALALKNTNVRTTFGQHQQLTQGERVRPAQDLQRLRQQTKIVEGNEYRTIYLGLDQKNPELKYSSIKGKNPFADQRVREALYVAIDIEAIKKAVMRGSSAPTGTMVAPQVHGYTKELAQRLPYSQDRAKELLKEAGYDNSLTFTLDCPNDRYINDEAIMLREFWNEGNSERFEQSR